MPPVPFSKYHGTGNDFVLIDHRALFFPKDDQALVARLCHRRFGIGADGLMLLEAAEGYDFRMVYYNADGKESSMCGNGGRCIVAFAKALGLVENHCRFLAIDGEHEARIEGETVSLKMQDVEQVTEHEDYYELDTGSPHYVRFVEDVAGLPVVEKGREVRFSPPYREAGINVNFVEGKGEHNLAVRTYERGVEAETYSCGTGVTACALAAHLRGMPSPVRIQTPGGELAVSFERQGQAFRNIWLKGPARFVFVGDVDV